MTLLKQFPRLQTLTPIELDVNEEYLGHLIQNELHPYDALLEIECEERLR